MNHFSDLQTAISPSIQEIFKIRLRILKLGPNIVYQHKFQLRNAHFDFSIFAMALNEEIAPRSSNLAIAKMEKWKNGNLDFWR